MGRDHQDQMVRPGGALFQRLVGRRISNQRMMRAFTVLVLATAIFCWLPLLLLSTAEGTLLRGNTSVPFLTDLEVHVRFLLALPILMMAEVSMEKRLSPLGRLFLQRDLIPEDARARFEAIRKSAIRQRKSIAVEIVLVVLVYTAGVFFWRRFLALDAPTWHATPAAGGLQFSLAGTWYQYVSLPIFQFLLWRWYFWIWVWHLPCGVCLRSN